MNSISTPYRIVTERLVVRCWDLTDSVALRASLDRSGDHLRPWIPFMKLEPRTLDETLQWLRKRRAAFDGDESHSYAVFSADESTLIGDVMLFSRVGENALEVGYWIDADQTRQGFGLEATAAMVRLAFEFRGVERLELHCAPGNLASVAMARKLGFDHEATLKGRYRDNDGAPQDTMIWSLFAADYPSSLATTFHMEFSDALGRPLIGAGR